MLRYAICLLAIEEEKLILYTLHTSLDWRVSTTLLCSWVTTELSTRSSHFVGGFVPCRAISGIWDHHPVFTEWSEKHICETTKPWDPKFDDKYVFSQLKTQLLVDIIPQSQVTKLLKAEYSPAFMWSRAYPSFEGHMISKLFSKYTILTWIQSVMTHSKTCN